ncbi:MAG: hypothetical protein ACLQU2_00485 [Candidatus Binataceae bacterium]
MKAAAYGLLTLVVALIMLAMPMKALAHDHGWHRHGHHYGWYKHHGWYDRYPGYWRYGDDDWRGGYAYRGYPYPGNMVCDHDGDRCWPAPSVSPWGYGYWPMDYSGPAANGIAFPTSSAL